MVYDLKGRSNVVPIAYAIAQGLENRGEDVAGISYIGEGDSLRTEKGRGLVTDVLGNIARTRFGTAAVIHNRYKTSGGDGMAGAQPFHYSSREPSHDVAIAHNGNIDPGLALEELRAAKRAENIASDTDAMGRLLQLRFESGMGILDAVRSAWPKFDGAHNVAGLRRDGSGFAWRDERGMHPLVTGMKGDIALVASEDYPIKHALGNGVKLRDVEPGELLEFRRGAQPTSHRILENVSGETAHCIFEWWYFAKRWSTLDQAHVYTVRHRAGERLADLDRRRWAETGTEPIVVPVPNSAMAIAEGYIHTLHHLSRVDGIIRNEKATRTFIAETQHRQSAVDTKYRFKHDLMKDRDLVLMDDSIVRGPTMKAIVGKLRAGEGGGAKSVHVRIAFPPVLAPCFYGINMSTQDELFMTKFRHMELDGASQEDIENAMAQQLEADSVNFLPVSMVSDVLGIDDKHLCHACTRAQYPTKTGQARYEAEARKTGLIPLENTPT